jgi:hypothetical protein
MALAAQSLEITEVLPCGPVVMPTEAKTPSFSFMFENRHVRRTGEKAWALPLWGAFCARQMDKAGTGPAS